MRRADRLRYGITILSAAAMSFPLVWLLSSSLKQSDEIFSYPPKLIPSDIRWANFPDAVDFLTARAFINSVIFSVAVVVLQLMLAMPCGFALARLRFRGARALLMVFAGSMVIPPQVMLIPVFIIVRDLQLLDTYAGLILPIAGSTGFGTFLFAQYFRGMPHELFEAARVDGANWLTTFVRIAAPLAKPAVAAFSAVTFLTAWNLYAWPLVAARSSDLRTLPVALAQLGTNDTFVPVNVGLNATLLSTIPLFVAFTLAQRSFERGLAGAGLKG